MYSNEQLPEFYSPLRENFIQDDLKENDFYVKAKANLESSRKWANIIGFLSICMMIFGFIMIILRYIFLFYGIESGSMSKWILGFLEGILIVFVSFFGLFSCMTSKLPNIRQFFALIV
jgi:hypothetical protein